MQIAPENPLAFPRADVRAGSDFAKRCRLVDVRIHPREHLLEPLFSGIRTRTRRFQPAFLQHIQQDLRQCFPHAEFKPRFFLLAGIKGTLKRTQACRVRSRQIQPKKGRSLLNQRANIFDIKHAARHARHDGRVKDKRPKPARFLHRPSHGMKHARIDQTALPGLKLVRFLSDSDPNPPFHQPKNLQFIVPMRRNTVGDILMGIRIVCRQLKQHGAVFPHLFSLLVGIQKTAAANHTFPPLCRFCYSICRFEASINPFNSL